jgi:hypothetical protein
MLLVWWRMIDPDYFAKKRAELGMDRADVLEAVQATLDSWYPGQTRVRRLHQGTLRIVTPSASVAADLRLRQVELLARHDLAGTRLALFLDAL